MGNKIRTKVWVMFPNKPRASSLYLTHSFHNNAVAAENDILKVSRGSVRLTSTAWERGYCLPYPSMMSPKQNYLLHFGAVRALEYCIYNSKMGEASPHQHCHFSSGKMPPLLRAAVLSLGSSRPLKCHSFQMLYGHNM